MISSKEVRFDSDGTGRPQKYASLRPRAALLVRDPQHKSKIESGRQLFGNVTWWMFWRNGYQALAALDDTMDGLPAANSLGFHSGSTGIKTASAILAK